MVADIWRTGSGRWSLGIVALVVVLSITAPGVAPYDPERQDVVQLLQSPSAAHPLGTDDLGRDTLSRVIYGAQPALAVSVVSTGLAVILGTAIGLVAGYWGGILDAVLMRILDGLLAIPMLALALATTGVLGPSLGTVMLVVGIANVPVFARLVRGQVLAIRKLEYVLVAQSLGALPARVLVWHVLPNILAALLVQMSLSMATSVLAEAGLSFLGLGMQPPTATWGGMLSTARGFLQRDPWFAIAPGVAIGGTVLAFNLLGDALRDTLDPRLRRL